MLSVIRTLAQIALPPSIAKTAQFASTACSMGQGLEANARIDELKKTIALVSDLFAATQITDPPPTSRKSSPKRFSTISGLSIPGSTAGLSPPIRLPAVTVVQDTGQALLHFSSGRADLNAVDSQCISDTSDLSRKRCASSTAGDRVIKALKMEPQEDHLHIMPQPTASSSFPPTTVASMVPFIQPNPPPEAASRPPSSAGLPHNAFNDLSHRPTTPSVPGIGFTSAPTTSADFISSSPLPTTVVHPGHFPPPVRTSWPDGTATIPSRTHQHSLSGNSLATGISFQSIPSTSTGLPPLPFSSTGTFATASSQSRPITVGGAGISPPIGRVSRSGSFTNNNAFAFGLPEVPSVNGALDFLQPSLSTLPTKQAAHSPTSSQEGENDFDSDGGDYSQSQSPESSSGNNSRTSTHPQVSRPIHNNRSSVLLTQNSTENLTTSNHANEVPQEYRAEVDRIFFEFLNNVCSNRKHTCESFPIWLTTFAVEATDAKGEPIHQTLMAKKMQRLDESPDFRPFKFRIQAFTNAFLEEASFPGYSDLNGYFINSDSIARPARLPGR